MAETQERIGLHNLKPAPGARKVRKRVGRGEGSGTGKTAGRGQKGWGARSGAKDRAWRTLPPVTPPFFCRRLRVRRLIRDLIAR